MKEIFSKVLKVGRKGVDFLFPPHCLHCDIALDKDHLFCMQCATFFELIDPMCRCIYCFSTHNGRAPCRECIEKKRWHVKMASALDYFEAVSSLVKEIKYGKMPYLAKTASAFMIAQFFRLKWPTPDYIIPVPCRQWFQGENHAHLLATHLALRLQAPCLPLIKRRAGDDSQARLSKEQREKLCGRSFYLTRPALLEDKIILLIDDVITTGSTLHRCAEVAKGGFPAKIFALSLARSCTD